MEVAGFGSSLRNWFCRKLTAVRNRCSRKGDTQEEAGMYVTGAVSGQGPAPRVHGWADSGEVILSLGQASGTRFLGDERSLGWSCGTDS